MTRRFSFQLAAPLIWLALVAVGGAAVVITAFRSPAWGSPVNAVAFDTPSVVAARPISHDSAIINRGRLLYRAQCALCHGESGDGAGQFASLMTPRPRDFRKGRFKLTSTTNQIPSDADLFRTISRGMPGSSMPAWKQLSPHDLTALVAFVRKIHADAVSAELDRSIKNGELAADQLQSMLDELTRPGPPIVVPAEPQFDASRRRDARRIYLEACSACHGPDGRPDPATVCVDEDGYPDPPRSFRKGVFKGGSAGGDLFVRISKGMRGTPMPAFDSAYSSDEIWNVVHHIQDMARSSRQGNSPLPAVY